MAAADDLFREGDIDGARAALVDIVRAKPGDVPARLFLFQLLCVAGEWEKARGQLKTLAQLSPEAQMLSVAYGHAIDAEIERASVFAGTSTPAVLVRDSGWAGSLATALGHAAAGRTEEAEAARAQAFDAAPDTPGRFNDTPFEWIADMDPRFGPAFEAIIAGRWGLVPFDAVEKITSEGPKDLRDIVWYPVQIGFKTGQSVAAMLPARYPGSEAASDTGLRLTRSTDWIGDNGVGQHVLMLSDGSEQGLLSLRSLVFG